MADIVVGSAAVTIVPSSKGFLPKLKSQVMPGVEKLAKDIGDKFERNIASSVKKGITEGLAGTGPQSKRQGGSSGEDFGGSFAKSAKSRIEAALKSLPKAQIGVATGRADQQLKDLRAELQSLLDKEIGIDLSDLEAIAKIDELKFRLDELAASSPSVQVQVDTLGASAQLLAFRTELAALTGGGGPGGVGGVAKLGGSFSGIAGSVGSAASSSGVLLAFLAAIAVALIPVVASAAGLAAALVIPFAAAGGGLTLFAILGGKAISNTLKTAKAIDELRKKAATLQDPKAAKAAAEQADALEKSLTGPQQAFLKARTALSESFGKLLGGKTGDALFKPIVAGMTLLAKILPKLRPVIVAVSDALTAMISSVDASGGGFSKFINGFAKVAGSTIATAGKSIALFGKGLFNIFAEFLPLSQSVGGGLVALGEKFVQFSQKASTKEGIAKFIDYVRTNGPVVAKFFGDLVVAVVRFSAALAPIGAAMIRVGSAIVSAFNKLPIGAVRFFFEHVLLGPIAFIIDAFRATGTSISDLGPVFDAVGRGFRAVYNAVIGPVFAFMLQAISKVLYAAGVMFTTLGKAPGFGWATTLGEKLKDAAKKADGLSDAIDNIPDSHNTDIKADNKQALKAIRQVREGLNNLPFINFRVPNPKIDRRQRPTAKGGTFNGAQSRLIAEAGPEAVVPLNRPLSQVDPSVRWLSAIAQGQGGGMGGGSRAFTPNEYREAARAGARQGTREGMNGAELIMRTDGRSLSLKTRGA